MPLVVSGRSVGALAGQAARLGEFLESESGVGVSLGDVGWSLATGRAGLEHRAVVFAGDRGEAVAGLGAVAAGVPSVSVVSGGVVSGGVGVVFSGQGAQRLGMGRGLYEGFPVFAGVFDEVCGLVDGVLGGGFGGFGVRDVLWAVEGSEGAGWLGETVFTQVGLFAFEVALFRLWESLGVVPGVVAGHSVGEVVAAHVAGVLSLEDAVRVVVARGRLMQGLERGVMVSVGASLERVEGLVGERDGVWVSGVNGPLSVVVAGRPGVVEGVVGVLEGEGVRCRWLEVSRAFHTPLVEPMLGEFEREIAGVVHRRGGVPVVSGVSGEVVGDGEWGVGYWVEQARCAVRFDRVVEWFAGRGVGKVVEVGPRGVLTALVREGLPDSGSAVVVVPSCRSRVGEVEAFTAAVGSLVVAGVELDWGAVF
ncbi:acyltransferase domain-containing protein, partial [Streptomyces aculeolatus]|uniref:acyltransferase domain-containing protein n=1 Tax=Streptomyces aculeolatus TaxID=270689 RepID=UPI001CED0288